MDTLYPKDYEAPVEEETVKDTKKLKEFIKDLVKEPMVMSKIIDAVDQKYVETADEDYHYLGQDIEAVCKEIDAEWNPEKKEEVTEPLLTV